ncbi:MAG: 2-hydroxyacid dehydrogenase [Gammaproteobacteria bacterium]
MSKPRLIITRRWPLAVEEKLTQDFDVVLNRDDTPMGSTTLIEAMQSCDVLCPTVSDKISADIINCENRRAKLIANFGVGFNHIDIEAAKASNVRVSNTPHVLTDCTADLAMTLMMMVARRAGEGERHVRNNEWVGWRPTHMMGTKITGKTLGLIGFGRIAQAMARKAHFGFGMPIIFYTPSPPQSGVVDELGAISCPSVEDVLAQADFVSLHCPGGEATRHLINENRLSAMQSHAFLINTARGDVIDQQALIQSLGAGDIAGAGLDVYEGEPDVPAELKNLNNVVLLPHLGSATTETRVAMGLRVIDNIEAFIKGDSMPDQVA